MLSQELKDHALLLRRGPVMATAQDGVTKVCDYAKTNAVMLAAAMTLESTGARLDIPEGIGWMLRNEFDRMGDQWGEISSAIDAGEMLKDADEVLAWYRTTFPDQHDIIKALDGALPNLATRAYIEGEYAVAKAGGRFIVVLGKTGSQSGERLGQRFETYEAAEAACAPYRKPGTWAYVDEAAS